MTRSIGANLLTHYQSGDTTIAWGFKVTRTDAVVYGFTSAQQDAEISGVTYLAAPGLEIANLVSSAGFAVDNTELNILADDVIFTVPDLLAGRWNNAAFELFQYNWADLTMGRDVRLEGNFGVVQPRKEAFAVELRGLQQYLQHNVGSISTKTCRARFADFPAAVNDTVKCRLVAGDFTVTGTIDGVTSNQVFEDTTRAEADDYFGEGIITWTGGFNTGLSQKIKTFTVGGEFTLTVGMIFDVQVGDTYSVIAGCRKRVDEDCITKFNNVLNFQAEPHRPTIDELTKAPETNV